MQNKKEAWEQKEKKSTDWLSEGWHFSFDSSFHSTHHDEEKEQKMENEIKDSLSWSRFLESESHFQSVVTS